MGLDAWESDEGKPGAPPESLSFEKGDCAVSVCAGSLPALR
jgi:hypothetical protein